MNEPLKSIPYTSGPFATAASRATGIPFLEEENMPTTAEEIASEIFEGTNGTESERHFQDVQANEPSQLAEELSRLDLFDRQEMSFVEYELAVLRDYVDQYPTNPYWVMNKAKNMVWNCENHGNYSRDTLLPDATKYSQKLDASPYKGSDQHQAAVAKHEAETRAKKDGMLDAYSAAAALRILHDEIGYEFHQRAEIEGFYYKFKTPMSEQGIASHGGVKTEDATTMELADLNAEVAAALAEVENYFDGTRKGTESPDDKTLDEFNQLA